MGTAVQNGALWGAQAKTWGERQEPFAAPLWRAMIEASGVGRRTRLLDVACGAGGALRLAAERGAIVSGVDASDALVAIARESVSGTFAVGDMEALPFEDHAFDVVMATNAIQYASAPLQAVREIVRVTARDGRVAIGMWAEPAKNEMADVFAAIRTVAPPPPGAPQPLDLASRDVLLRVLGEGGLRVESDAEVPCLFSYEDEVAYWTAQRSAGVVEGAAQRAGEEAVRDAVLAAGKPFVQPDGRVVFHNTMRFVCAVPAHESSS